jgi:menaquinone-dependent protoporphyrinogen oxidase
MKRIAVVVWSRYGQTYKIAERTAEVLRQRGFEPEIYSLSTRPMPAIDLSLFEGVVLGCPIYAAKYAKEMVEWTTANAAQLNANPCAFFSVGLQAASQGAEGHEAERAVRTSFLDSTGLNTDLHTSIAGALNYPDYNVLVRWVMKRLATQHGWPLDTSQSYEMTDWAEVDAFADRFARSFFARYASLI